MLSGALPGSNLLSLNVAFNDASDEGLSALLEAVGKSNIYSLYILGNNFSPSSAEVQLHFPSVFCYFIKYLQYYLFSENCVF